MADLVKRQHFVPRTYLKHFSEQSGDKYFIHALRSEATHADRIFNSNITNVAFEKHLYTLPGETIEQQMAVEKLYSEELEVHYDSIYEILTDPNKTEITSQERELIISTVVTMYYRTTKWLNTSRNLIARVLESAYQLCEQKEVDYFTYENEKNSIAGKNLEEFTREFSKERQPGMVLIQLETAFKLIALRVLSDSICVNKIEGENL